MNINTTPEHLNSYKKYVLIKKLVHMFLQKKGFLPIDLPVLSPALVPESYLEVFETQFLYNGNKKKLYLTPSPELFLKRLLSYGIGDCYYLGKAFRNSDPPAQLHHMEFTMLEIYKIGASYLDIADLILMLFQYIVKHLYKRSSITYQHKRVDFARYEKITVEDAFLRYASITNNELYDKKCFLHKAEKKGYQVSGFSYEDVFSQIYVQEIEPFLGINGYPTLLYDYPKEFAALAKLNKNGKTAQRFEIYIEGVEIGDCYTELTDPKEQMMRFNEEQMKRKKLKKITHPIDKGFIEALQYGLGNCAGIAIGFERLAMILTDKTSLKELKLIHINV